MNTTQNITKPQNLETRNQHQDDHLQISDPSGRPAAVAQPQKPRSAGLHFGSVAAEARASKSQSAAWWCCCGHTTCASAASPGGKTVPAVDFAGTDLEESTAAHVKTQFT